MSLRDLQIIAFCLYLHFTQCPNIFGIGDVEPLSILNSFSPHGNLWLRCLSFHTGPLWSTRLLNLAISLWLEWEKGGRLDGSQVERMKDRNKRKHNDVPVPEQRKKAVCVFFFLVFLSMCVCVCVYTTRLKGWPWCGQTEPQLLCRRHRTASVHSLTHTRKT